MGEKIYLADKKTLDDVNKTANQTKTTLDKVDSKIDKIQEGIANIKSISGSYNPGSVRDPEAHDLDWTRYEGIEKYEIVSSRKFYPTVFEISGRGYIRDLIITSTEYYNCTKVKIEVDDKVITSFVTRKGQSGRYCYGMVYIGDDKGGRIGKIEYEHYDASKTLAQPLFFNKSVKVIMDEPLPNYDIYFLGGIAKR